MSRRPPANQRRKPGWPPPGWPAGPEPATPEAAAPVPPLDCPFTVVIDTREQAPFRFEGLRADARDGHRPLHVPVVRYGLPTGDYSIRGLEQRIAIERKSLADLFHTLGQDRARFERELERLSALDCAAVVIEASWPDIVDHPPERSQLPPKVVHRSIIAWCLRHRVAWWPCGNRHLAEVTAFRILEYFWRQQQQSP